MKLTKITGLLAIAAIFFSSCGSLSISQKRYSNGLNIDWFAAKEDKASAGKERSPKPKKEVKTLADNPETAETTTVPESADQTLEQNTTVASNTAESAVGTSESNTENNADVSDVEVKKTKPAKFGLRKQIQAFQSLKENVQSLSHIKPETNSATKSTDATNDSDVNLILLILIAIFIPPLAVFLYFGEIEVHFWINLILWLIGGGIFLSSGGVLGVGLAFIHALLVIFGVFG